MWRITGKLSKKFVKKQEKQQPTRNQKNTPEKCKQSGVPSSGVASPEMLGGQNVWF